MEASLERRNNLGDYVGDLLTILWTLGRAPGKMPDPPPVPRPVQALRRHEQEVCLMLELLDNRLRQFHQLYELRSRDCFEPYAQALCFLDAAYIFTRMMFDSAAGVVRHFYRLYDRCDLPKSFNKMLGHAVPGAGLPSDLGVVFVGVGEWFTEFRKRRGHVVHDYETYLVALDRVCDGEIVFREFSPGHAGSEDDVYAYFGRTLAGYQRFVDRLLDHLDGRFAAWCGVHPPGPPRNPSVVLGRDGNLLRWAQKYGGYIGPAIVT